MKRITGYDDYAVTESGEVYSFKHHRRRIRKPRNVQGYMQIGLSSGFVKKEFKVHRLVAMMYIPNPNNRSQVNHKDGNKLNNHVSNLEWATPSENVRHAFANKLAKSGKDHYCARVVLDTETGVFYETVEEASKLCSIGFSALYAMQQGRNYNYTNLKFV